MFVRLSLVALLGGCAEPDPERMAAVLSLTGDAGEGETTFDGNCRGCHGPEGAGVPLGGPSLQVRPWSAEEVVEQVLAGGFGMPAFDGELSDQEMVDVAAYVSETLAVQARQP